MRETGGVTFCAMALLAGTLVWGGCLADRTGPRVVPMGEISASDTPDRLGAARGEVRAPVESAVEEVVRSPDDLSVCREALRVTQGFEWEFFATLLGRARNETRDFTGALEMAGAAVGRARRGRDLLAMAREIQHRECCMSRTFLAASLEGLQRGLGDQSGGMAVEEETIRRFAELSGHADEGIAAAALGILSSLVLDPVSGPPDHSDEGQERMGAGTER